MASVATYRKKPVEVEAIQLTWDNWNEICDFVDVGKMTDGKPQGGWVVPNTPSVIWYEEEPPSNDAVLGLAITTLEGVMIAEENDWIIKGIQGEFYPCKPDIFEATYEPADDLVLPPDNDPEPV